MSQKKTIEDSLQLTPLECEVITLKAVLDMIGDMVNYETMTFFFSDPDSSVMFQTKTHMDFFSIILVDLLSEPRDFFQGAKNYIDRLRDVCDNPLMSKDDIRPLRAAVSSFSNWLSQEVVIENRWFPAIDLNIDLRIQRHAFIRMCGNITKHNFTQLTRQAAKLKAIFEENGKTLPLDRCVVALEDFREQFYIDVFQYHSSTISEFLNNIRWGIYTYAHRVRSAYVENRIDAKSGLTRYEYSFPNGIATDLGRACFWSLMNDVIQTPYVQKFEVMKVLKMRY